MKFKGIIAVLLLTTLLTGCASIVGQSIFPVTINSNPPEAKIIVTDERGVVMFAGTTPSTMTVPAGESYFHAKTYQVKLSKAGYGDQIVTVKADIDGWYFGNILFGGLIGFLIVDPITGKMWKITSNQAFGNLSPLAEGSQSQAVQPAVVPPTAPINTSVPAEGNGGNVTQPKASLKKGTPVLQIATLDQVPEELKKQMVRIN